jgi:hypothetical protein
VEKADFPLERDLFYFLARKMKENRVLKENEGWMFSGYGQCTGYSLDEDIKPKGKWIFMHFLDMSRFPLREQVIKLQPPHVASGKFSSPDRTVQFRIVKCRPEKSNFDLETVKQGSVPENIIQFPGQHNR